MGQIQVCQKDIKCQHVVHLRVHAGNERFYALQLVNLLFEGDN